MSNTTKPPGTAGNGRDAPVHTIRIGNVRAEIWLDDDYKEDVGFTATFTLADPRTRRSTCFSVRDGHAFTHDELAQLSVAALGAASWIQTKSA